jgi:hypothetical protein
LPHNYDSPLSGIFHPPTPRRRSVEKLALY